MYMFHKESGQKGVPPTFCDFFPLIITTNVGTVTGHTMAPDSKKLGRGGENDNRQLQFLQF